MTGCSTPRMRGDTATAPTDDGDTYYDTEVAIGPCALTGGKETPLALIASALITSAVSAGVDRIGTALAEAAKPSTTKIYADRNLQLTAATVEKQCIEIVRGWFYRDPAYNRKLPFEDQPKLRDAEGRLADSFLTADQLSLLWANRLWLATAPEFVFEGLMGHAANDRSARFVYPLLVRMDEPAATRPLRPGKARHVVVFLGFEMQDSVVNIDSAPGATLPIGRLEAGVPITFPQQLPPGTAVAQIMDSAGETMQVDANSTPFESDWFKLQLGTGVTPVRLKALVTETQDGSEFLQFVSDVFGGAKETIKTQANTLIDPVTRAAAEAKERQAEQEARDALDVALATALDNLGKCALVADSTTGPAKDARTAMRKYDAARRVLGDGPVFHEKDYDAIPIGGDADTIKAGCSAARKKLEPRTT